jgi:periplasmic protein TonB
MQREFVGSALIHGGLVVTALVWMGLPRQDDAPAMGSVTVDIISSSLVTSNQTESIESDATETLVLSGSQATITDIGDAPQIEPLVPETVVLQPDSITPLTAEAIEPTQQTEPLETTATADAAASESLVFAALNTEIVETVGAPPALEPIETSEKPQPVAPVMPVSRPPDLAAPKPAPRPSETKPVERTAPRPAPQQAGNGGNSDQDSAAARSSGGDGGQGSGGSADEARYPGQVERKVARALRYPNDARGARGEVQVAFTLDPSGSLLSLAIVRSSGDAILDQAALTTVQRAAPFPAFPAGIGRNSWDFSIPLAFARD